MSAGPSENAAQPIFGTRHNPIELHSRLMSGERDPFAEGLVHRMPSLSSGIKQNLYTQPRVSRMHPDGSVKEAEIVKIKSMHDLTPDGEMLEDTLHGLIASGEFDFSPKRLGHYRVARPGLRKASVDEWAQLYFNVGQRGKELFPDLDLMKIDLVNAGRPPLAREVVLRGDNSADTYNRALEIAALEFRAADRFEMHAAVANAYGAGLFTIATADGHRELDTPPQNVAWIRGVMRHEEIKKLPRAQQMKARAAIATRTVAKVVQVALLKGAA